MVNIPVTRVEKFLLSYVFFLLLVIEGEKDFFFATEGEKD